MHRADIYFVIVHEAQVYGFGYILVPNVSTARPNMVIRCNTFVPVVGRLVPVESFYKILTDLMHGT